MIASAIPKVHHRSTDYPAAERFARWQEVVQGSFDDATGPRDAAEDESFEVESSMWNLGKALLFNSRLQGRQTKCRSANRIRSDQLDHYRIHLQRKGKEHNDAAGRRNVLTPGDLLVTDMSREETLATDYSECTIIVLPREMLDEVLPRPMDLHGAMPKGLLVDIFSKHLAALADNADQIQQGEANLLVEATVQMLGGALAHCGDARLDAAAPVTPGLLRQACRYIDMHLADELSAADLCEAFGISRSALYRLFGPLGGVNGFIRERRLARAHEVLRAAGPKLNLARVAADHGFAAPSHFSRAFRDQFGYSPSEVTRYGMAGPAGAPGADARGSALPDWLRSLRD